MKRILLALFFLIHAAPFAAADAFGVGANSFQIEFVTIDEPGNPADTTGAPNPAGAVAYVYRIGKREISEQMIDKAVASGGLSISHRGLGADYPATLVSWFESAQFVNWLNESTGHAPAYKFENGVFALWQSRDAGYDSSNPFRNSEAFYFLPSVDEWYKAAYYDAALGLYHDYPVGSDSAPDGIDAAGDLQFETYYNEAGVAPRPSLVNDVGLSSPQGTFGQGGNVNEWLETEHDLVNDSMFGRRQYRGGSWRDHVSWQSSAGDRGEYPHLESNDFGFRVASRVVEPSSLLLGASACLGALLRLRNRV